MSSNIINFLEQFAPVFSDTVRGASWLKRITVNECISWSRQQERFLRLRGRMENHDNPVPTPHQEYEEKEINAAVRKAMESLSEKNRLAMTLYYIDGLSQVVKLPGIDNLIHCRAISEALEKSPSKLDRISEPGFGQSRTNYDWEMALDGAIIHLLQDGGRVLDYGLKVGESWTMEVFSYTFKPLRATRNIESYSETVSVAAGNFSDCLKLKTVVTSSPDDDGPERERELNRINCGTEEEYKSLGE